MIISQVLRDRAVNRRVVCAANRHRETRLIVCGARHFDGIMRSLMENLGGFPFWLDCDQGFIDQYGNFLTRHKANRIAIKNKQFRGTQYTKNTLYSENLY